VSFSASNEERAHGQHGLLNSQVSFMRVHYTALDNHVGVLGISFWKENIYDR